MWGGLIPSIQKRAQTSYGEIGEEKRKTSKTTQVLYEVLTARNKSRPPEKKQSSKRGKKQNEILLWMQGVGFVKGWTNPPNKVKDAADQKNPEKTARNSNSLDLLGQRKLRAGDFPIVHCWPKLWLFVASTVGWKSVECRCLSLRNFREAS